MKFHGTTMLSKKLGSNELAIGKRYWRIRRITTKSRMIQNRDTNEAIMSPSSLEYEQPQRSNNRSKHHTPIK